jgi:hypothetical protein
LSFVWSFLEVELRDCPHFGLEDELLQIQFRAMMKDDASRPLGLLRVKVRERISRLILKTFTATGPSVSRQEMSQGSESLRSPRFLCKQEFDQASGCWKALTSMVFLAKVMSSPTAMANFI